MFRVGNHLVLFQIPQSPLHPTRQMDCEVHRAPVVLLVQRLEKVHCRWIHSSEDPYSLHAFRQLISSHRINILNPKR